MNTLTLSSQTKMFITSKSGTVNTFLLKNVDLICFGDGNLETVDLGLPSKTLWASCNIGALVPEDFGNYFSWACLKGQQYYTNTDYKFYNRTTGVYEYFNLEDISGNVQYDAAVYNLGEKWKIPTKIQVEELIDKCIWTWGERNSINGYIVTGPSGKNIFLPAGGKIDGKNNETKNSCGFYWTSILSDISDSEAYTLEIDSGNKKIGYEYRHLGIMIRPVE